MIDGAFFFLKLGPCAGMSLSLKAGSAAPGDASDITPTVVARQ